MEIYKLGHGDNCHFNCHIRLLFIGQASPQLATLVLELRLNFLLEEAAERNEVTQMQVTRI